MSYAGSAARIMAVGPRGPWRILTWPLLALATLVAWVGVTCWYAVFGILVAPYRLLRRGQRRDKLERRREQELLERAGQVRR